MYRFLCKSVCKAKRNWQYRQYTGTAITACSSHPWASTGIELVVERTYKQLFDLERTTFLRDVFTLRQVLSLRSARHILRIQEGTSVELRMLRELTVSSMICKFLVSMASIVVCLSRSIVTWFTMIGTGNLSSPGLKKIWPFIRNWNASQKYQSIHPTMTICLHPISKFMII